MARNLAGWFPNTLNPTYLEPLRRGYFHVLRIPLIRMWSWFIYVPLLNSGVTQTPKGSEKREKTKIENTTMEISDEKEISIKRGNLRACERMLKLWIRLPPALTTSYLQANGNVNLLRVRFRLENIRDYDFEFEVISD